MSDRPDTEAIAATDRILNEWRMEDSGELWCPVEEQPRLVHAVTAPLLAALATAEERRDEAERWGKEGWDWLDDVLGAIHPDATVFNFRELLAAKYHKATGQPKEQDHADPNA